MVMVILEVIMIVTRHNGNDHTSKDTHINYHLKDNDKLIMIIIMTINTTMIIILNINIISDYS